MLPWLACMHIFFCLCARYSSSLFYSPDDADAVYVDSETRIQVLPSMSYLPSAEKEQLGAFIVRSSCLLLLIYLRSHSYMTA